MTKVAVVTGASAGVGRACVRRFAKAGYDVGLIARGEDGLKAAVRDVESAGVRALAVPTDVADDAAVASAAGQIEKDLGPVDVWVNNAMATVFGPFVDLSPQEFDRVIAVTFLGQVNGTRAALRHMRPRNRGAIIQVGSALAYRGIPLQAAYCASKHATQGFVDSLRAELIHEHSGVHVGMVQLSAMNTPQFDIQRTKMKRKAQPVPPIFQPEVAADAILFAAEKRRREMWVGFPTVQAVVGDKVAPGLLDEFLGVSGVDSQQRDEAIDPGAPDALFEPMPGDRGVRGSFDDIAKNGDFQTRLEMSPLVQALRSGVGKPIRKLGVAVLNRVAG